MQRVRQLLMISFLVLSSFKAAQAANYYVDYTSGSDSNSGTSSAPWKSLSKVNSTTFQAGDTINFKRGSVWTGALQVKNSGTTTSLITYQAYGSGAAPQIRNPGVNYGNTIEVTGDFNIINGFLLTDTHQAGVYLKSGADRNIVRNNEMTRTGFGVLVDGQYNLITKNYVHDLSMIVNDTTPDNDYGAVCFWVAGPNNEISYNRGINCKAPSRDFGSDGGFVEVWQNGNNTYIHHNWAENTQGFFELGAGGTGSAQNITVAYNVLYNTSGGVCFNTGSYNITVTNFKFENNTLYGQSGDGYRVFACRSDLSFLQVRNNIFYSNIQIANTGSFTHTNNLYHMVNMVNGSGIGYALGSSEKTANPLFVNVGAKDFHLQASSPAINAGTNLGYTKDFEDKPVPAGAAPDMGAYEYGAGGTPPPDPDPTPTPGVTTIDDSVIGSGTNQFNYVGSWNHCTACGGSGEYNQTSSWSNIANDNFTLAFTGTQVKFYGIQASHHGMAAVSIDGGKETVVDLYSAVRAGNVLLWTSPVLTYGNHTFKLRLTGTKNLASSDVYIGFDRMDVVVGTSDSTPLSPPQNLRIVVND